MPRRLQQGSGRGCGGRTRRGAASPSGEPQPLSSDVRRRSGGRRAVSPVARKLATELKIDLDRVNGTGPGGRVTREDIERAAKTAALSAAVLRRAHHDAALADSAAPGAQSSMRTLPLRGIRRTIATRMHQSLRDTAQLTITTEADVTAATELRTRLTREFDLPIPT